MEPAELLKKYFGYDTFRPMQEDVIKTILSGRDVLAVMPTGAGKSVCFQIPALLFPHGTIIISPLISLMKDQVEALAEQGISASYVNSTVPLTNLSSGSAICSGASEAALHGAGKTGTHLFHRLPVQSTPVHGRH
ncbi:MAG: DEAD/DEAH box helicase [Dialister invisus]